MWQLHYSVLTDCQPSFELSRLRIVAIFFFYLNLKKASCFPYNLSNLYKELQFYEQILKQNELNIFPQNVNLLKNLKYP